MIDIDDIPNYNIEIRDIRSEGYYCETCWRIYQVGNKLPHYAYPAKEYTPLYPFGVSNYYQQACLAIDIWNKDNDGSYYLCEEHYQLFNSLFLFDLVTSEDVYEVANPTLADSDPVLTLTTEDINPTFFAETGDLREPYQIYDDILATTHESSSHLDMKD